jgi:gluconate 2-dehydrogenase gamma chain
VGAVGSVYRDLRSPLEDDLLSREDGLKLHRRELLGSAAFLLMAGTRHSGAQSLPWRPDAGSPPLPVAQGPWLFFDAGEAAAVEALADRLIPPDPDTPGGKDAGCAVYIDRQLAGPYGRQAGLYVSPPFIKGTKEQGPQDEDGPAVRFRKALAALDQYCKTQKGEAFASLSDADKDAIIGDIEDGAAKLDGVDGEAFFALLLKNTQEGFFADPIYGGNRDMCAWRMIGFPGARYDYRDWVHRHNERYPHPPVSFMGRADWNGRKT